MLVKIGSTASLNMLAIDTVTIIPHKEVTKKGGLFQKEESESSIAVKVEYTNVDGKKASYTLYGFKDYQSAQKVYAEVLNQVKELENTGATQELEKALRDA